jgi:hypothetical protein
MGGPDIDVQVAWSQTKSGDKAPHSKEVWGREQRCSPQGYYEG